MKFKCIKKLYKSTYKSFAFKKDKIYNLSFEDEEFYFITDEEGNDFSFSKIANKPYYDFQEYLIKI